MRLFSFLKLYILRCVYYGYICWLISCPCIQNFERSWEGHQGKALYPFSFNHQICPYLSLREPMLFFFRGILGNSLLRLPHNYPSFRGSLRDFFKTHFSEFRTGSKSLGESSLRCRRWPECSVDVMHDVNTEVRELDEIGSAERSRVPRLSHSTSEDHSMILLIFISLTFTL